MRTRRAETDLTWNGAAVTSKMVGYKATVTYTDAASGEADSLEISMNDRDRQWTTAWMPKTGDTLTAAIKVYDWEREGTTGPWTADFSSWTITVFRGGQ